METTATTAYHVVLNRQSSGKRNAFVKRGVQRDGDGDGDGDGDDNNDGHRHGHDTDMGHRHDGDDSIKY